MNGLINEVQCRRSFDEDEFDQILTSRYLHIGLSQFTLQYQSVSLAQPDHTDLKFLQGVITSISARKIWALINKL